VVLFAFGFALSLLVVAFTARLNASASFLPESIENETIEDNARLVAGLFNWPLLAPVLDNRFIAVG
jgi:hypothetical protein